MRWWPPFGSYSLAAPIGTRPGSSVSGTPGRRRVPTISRYCPGPSPVRVRPPFPNRPSPPDSREQRDVEAHGSPPRGRVSPGFGLHPHPLALAEKSHAVFADLLDDGAALHGLALDVLS